MIQLSRRDEGGLRFSAAEAGERASWKSDAARQGVERFLEDMGRGDWDG